MFKRFALLALLLALSTPAFGEPRTFYGMRGLNTIPDARFDEKGTVTLTLSHADPYTSGALGFQFTDDLYITLRQTAESSGPFDSPDALYPGIDAKIKLLDENAYHPQIAIGLQSAFGHKRHAGEYITFSKRWHGFDLTGGLGWGRFGRGKHFSNPLKIISHFDKPRGIDGDIANDPADWFTGEDVGLFGGFSYDLPVKGLTFAADWNGDRYEAEQIAINYDHASPWSVGLHYQPADYVSAAVGILGTDKVIGRITLSPHIPKWPFTHKEKTRLPTYPLERLETADLSNIAFDAKQSGHDLILLNDDTEHEVHTALSVDLSKTTPKQLAHSLRYMGRNAPPQIRSLKITPTFAGLQGRSLAFDRRAIEATIHARHGSAEEIWQSVEFDKPLTKLPFKGLSRNSLLPDYFILEEHISLSEEDHGILKRTSLILEKKQELIGSYAFGTALRFNLTNNLEDLNTLRPLSVLPVRSDVDAFAQNRLSLDRFYLSYLKTIRPDLHLNITGGYLEEQYAGIGGEILFRPFDQNWAIGAEAWQVFKRNPYTSLNQGLTIDSLLTGHLNAWYKLPTSPETTINARLGRYLAEDIGGSLGLTHRFRNGAKLERFVTLTDITDLDVYGGNTNLHHGVKLSLPIGSAPYIPDNTRIDLIAAPFGRDAGQALNKPIDLYDMTEAFSLQHLAGNWSDIAQTQ